MDNYNFEKFTNAGAKLGNYTISVNNSYSFGISSGFYAKEGIRNFKRAILFYDKKMKAVAFKFTNDEGIKGTFAVTHVKNSASISARSFFISNEILKKEYIGKKDPKKIDDDNHGKLYVIDLLISK